MICVNFSLPDYRWRSNQFDSSLITPRHSKKKFINFSNFSWIEKCELSNSIDINDEWRNFVRLSIKSTSVDLTSPLSSSSWECADVEFNVSILRPEILSGPICQRQKRKERKWEKPITEIRGKSNFPSMKLYLLWNFEFMIVIAMGFPSTIGVHSSQHDESSCDQHRPNKTKRSC